jgi:hypothetical protein
MMKLKLAQAFSVILAAVVLAPAISCKRLSPNRDDVKLKEVQQLASALPLYPGFEDTGGGSTYSKSMSASVHKTYRSSARFDDVKTFYATQLTQTGWQLTKARTLKDGWSRDLGGRELRFEKGQYYVAIEYSGDKAIDPDWNYGVSVGWDDR